MFTLEESDLLARMLRVLGWILLCLVVVVAAFFVHRCHLLDRLAMLLTAFTGGAVSLPARLQRGEPAYESTVPLQRPVGCRP